MFEADCADGVVIDCFVVGIIRVVDERVVYGVEVFAGEIEVHAVREVSAVFEYEGGEGVAGLEHGHHGCHVGLGTGVGLDIGVFAAEELFGAVAGELFDLVVIFASAVVSAAWVSFRVFVGEACSHCVHDRFGDMVFGGDEFDG